MSVHYRDDKTYSRDKSAGSSLSVRRGRATTRHQGWAGGGREHEKARTRQRGTTYRHKVSGTLGTNLPNRGGGYEGGREAGPFTHATIGRRSHHSPRATPPSPQPSPKPPLLRHYPPRPAPSGRVLSLGTAAFNLPQIRSPIGLKALGPPSGYSDWLIAHWRNGRGGRPRVRLLLL